MSVPVRLSGDELLERALADRAAIAMRPQPTPRQVIGAWMENFGAGVGAGVVVYAAALFAPISGDPAFVAVTCGAIVWGLTMLARGTTDERARLRADRHVRQAVKVIGREAEAGLERMNAQLQDALDALDAADEEIQELRRGLEHMTRERDMAVHELSRERLAVQVGTRQTYVPPVEVTAQELRDATEMIRHRYQFGAHLSRRKADELKKWSQTRWDAAQKVLADARVIAVANGVTEYPQTLDAALQQFGEYLIHARQLSAPATNKALGCIIYHEEE
jgi:hypothetical protein